MEFLFAKMVMVFKCIQVCNHPTWRLVFIALDENCFIAVFVFTKKMKLKQML